MLQAQHDCIFVSLMSHVWLIEAMWLNAGHTPAGQRPHRALALCLLCLLLPLHVKRDAQDSVSKPLHQSLNIMMAEH